MKEKKILSAFRLFSLFSPFCHADRDEVSGISDIKHLVLRKCRKNILRSKMLNIQVSGFEVSHHISLIIFLKFIYLYFVISELWRLY